MINSKTRLIGIIGYPLGHTLSPIMQNKALQEMGLNYIYVPLEVKPVDIKKAIEAIRIYDLMGVNVTIPYKEIVMEHLDELSAEAIACEAVNLIKNEDGRLIGYNTDGKGFVAGLEEADVDVSGQILLLGAGGAARAVGHALATEGVQEMTFLDIDRLKAENLADFIRRKTGVSCYGLEMNRETFALAGKNADIIVNCTPSGMYPEINNSPIDDISMIKKPAVLCDLIYNPLQTKLLAMGRAHGLKIINGVPMLVHQGALTLEILTNLKPPIDIMREVVLHQVR
ncbi:MAG TPA: shikimate dehydrogenase [Syntrophomonadaceae bacterium]|nr:shikimate dehydrogenase [Syntrophomonadaceae bacterium]